MSDAVDYADVDWPETAKTLQAEVTRLGKVVASLTNDRKVLIGQREACMRDANRSVEDMEGSIKDIPGYWFGQVADQTNPDDEGTKLLLPVVVLAESEDDALTQVQDAAGDSTPDAEWVDYPVELRRATWDEITEHLATPTRPEGAESEQV